MTIKIGHLADSHFNERGRLQDIIDIHREFVMQAKEAEVDLIVHSGDWFERRSTPAERIALANFLEDAMYVAPVFGVQGNHDVDLDLSIFPKLDVGGDGLAIFDRPTAAPISAKELAYHGVGHRINRDFRIGLLALPWFDKSHIVSNLDSTVDSEETRQLTISAAQNVLTGIRAEATRLKNEGIVPILVAHVLVGGSEVSTGQTLIGTTVELAPGDLLDVGASYVALGHIHKAQEWFDGRVAYAGSPHRINFGENEPKGWRLVTLEDNGDFVSNEFMELPARKIVLVESDFTGPNELTSENKESQYLNLAVEIANLNIKNALVRFRYHIRSKDLHLVPEDELTRIFKAEGAAEIKIEAIVEHETRARAPDIVGARSTRDKINSFFAAKGIDVSDEQSQRLDSKLSEIEVSDAAQ